MAGNKSKLDKLFPKELDVRFIGDDEFYLLKDFTYKSDEYGIITCPKTYITDGASIPKWAQPFVGSPWSGKYPRAAVIHDWLCSSEGEILGKDVRITKKETDKLFKEMLEVLGVRFIKRHKMYRAVRIAKRKFTWEKNG